MSKLALYHYAGCFYCASVRKKLQGTSLDVELRDIHKEKGWSDELIAARGRRTVPVLRIEQDDGSVQWMPESRDIIHYIRLLTSD